MEALASLFKALADRNRMRIMAALLKHEELCGCQLTEFLNVAGATASRHLSQLQQARLVQSRKAGRWVYFRLSDEPPQGLPVAWLRDYLLSSPEIKRDLERMEVILRQDPEVICQKQRGSMQSDRQIAGRSSQKKRILFVCTGNSCRSQMAEGWANALLPDLLQAYSAGIEAHGLNPYAVQVMQEEGIDLSRNRSSLIEEFDLEAFDAVITVCDHARESCPILPPGCSVIHQGFDDPPRLAEQMEGEEKKLSCYRQVRDEIKKYVLALPEILAQKEKTT